MKLRLITMAMTAILALSPALLTAQDPPAPNPPANTPGVPKKDGTGPKVRKGKGQPGQDNPRMGKKTGPRDGTGPLHTPPNSGRRGGRK